MSPEILKQMAPAGRGVTLLMRGARRPYHVTVEGYTDEGMRAHRAPHRVTIPFADIVSVF